MRKETASLSGSVGGVSDWSESRSFNPHHFRQHSFIETDHDISLDREDWSWNISMVILSLLQIQEGHLSVLMG